MSSETLLSAEESLLHSIWDLFDAEGKWPLVRDVAMRLDRERGLAFEEIVLRVPAEFLYGVGSHRLPADDETIGLTIVGAATVNGASATVQLAVDSIRTAAQLYRDWTPPVGERGAELIFDSGSVPIDGQLSDAKRALLLDQVRELLVAEQWGWRSASRGSVSGQWSFSIDRMVRRFRDVVDVADYLGRARPGERHGLLFSGKTAHVEAPVKSGLAVTSSTNRGSDVTGRTVFLVHGRDHAARDSVVELLRAFDLRVVSWREAAGRAPGGGTPYTGDIVRAGMDLADAVVVLLTPDDVGYVRRTFREDRDGADDLQPTGQARLNVIFEAGMAMAIGRERVVLVEVGATRGLSDTAGINTIRLRGSVESRKDFAARLRSAGLAVDTESEAWRTVGNFDREPLGRVDLLLGEEAAAGNPDTPSGNPTESSTDQVRITKTLMVSKLDQLDSRFGTEVVGEITNTSERAVNTIILGATFFSAEGRIVGNADGVVNGLEGGQTKSIRLTSSGVIKGAIRFTIQSNGVV